MGPTNIINTEASAVTFGATSFDSVQFGYRKPMSAEQIRRSKTPGRGAHIRFVFKVGHHKVRIIGDLPNGSYKFVYNSSSREIMYKHHILQPDDLLLELSLAYGVCPFEIGFAENGAMATGDTVLNYDIIGQDHPSVKSLFEDLYFFPNVGFTGLAKSSSGSFGKKYIASMAAALQGLVEFDELV